MTKAKRAGKQFADQGGAASMDPSAFGRWLTSRYIRYVGSPRRLARQRARVERRRRRKGERHVVEYFHQVDDGYSHLAAQLLPALAETYDIEIVCHLVEGPSGRNAPEPDLLLDLSRYDAARVAPHYGLAFAEKAQAPDAERLGRATQILAGCNDASFVQRAAAVGRALWSQDDAALDALAEELGSTDAASSRARLRDGTARREELGHYSGAMFYYGKEWYWGVDRLYHLEQRLIDLDTRRPGAGEALLAPRPAIEGGPLRDDGTLTFEIYPSLRSPYTSFIFDAAVELARATGVKLVVRPVLPMVMRGVPATRQKGTYIFSDAAREARALGLHWGRACDPIGEPVRRCYSLYPWAREQGRDIDLLSAFLNAAFTEGVNTNRDAGMRHVVEAAGLDWNEAQTIIGNEDWHEELEANRLTMYEFGSWGVPSFRLLDAQGATVLALWGQDRLWLFAREIQRLLAER